MRLIVLSGHQRPIRKVQMNRDDDLLFTASSDGTVCVWDPETGERLGIYKPKGPASMVSDIDIDWNTKWLLTGSGDEYIRLWDVKTGKINWEAKIPTRVNSVNFSCGDRLILAANPYFRIGNQEACVRIFDNPLMKDRVNNNDDDGDDTKWNSEIFISKPNHVKTFGITKARWSPLNDEIFVLCSDGTIRIIDVNKEKEVKNIIFDKNIQVKQERNPLLDEALTDIHITNDYCRALVTSRSFEAKMFDIRQRKWNVLNVFSTNRGLNACAMHPKLDCCVLGGGKTAQQAALNKKNGNYEILFYSTIYKKIQNNVSTNNHIQMGQIQTDCFSPINSMTFNSDGSQFILGYEEGQVRIFSMDADFEDKYIKNENTFIKSKKDDDNSDSDDDDDQLDAW